MAQGKHRKHEPQRERRSARIATAFAVALATVAAGTIGTGLGGQRAAPRLPEPVITGSGSDRTSPSPPAGPERSPSNAAQVPAVRPLPAAEPASIDIPAIDVHASITELGLEPDGSVEVPPHAPPGASEAGWYRYSPTPGELGPSVLLGHIDSLKYGPAVFFRLADLRPGDTISIDRADGSTAVFRVTKMAQYPKTDFPTMQVYGNIDHAGLRLISCGGVFDDSEEIYTDNIVAYASLVSARPAQR